MGVTVSLRGRVVFIAVSVVLFFSFFAWAAGAEETRRIYNICDWAQFNEDYIDTDNDGEKDDFLSLNVNDTIDIVDRIINYTNYPQLDMSEIILESNPDVPVIFFNTIDEDIFVGWRWNMEVKIIALEEEDGDPGEYYLVTNVEYTRIEGGGGGGGDDDDDGGGWENTSLSDLSRTTICLFCAGAGAVVFVIIIIGAVINQFIKEKRGVKEPEEVVIQPHSHPKGVPPSVTLTYERGEYGDERLSVRRGMPPERPRRR